MICDDGADAEMLALLVLLLCNGGSESNRFGNESRIDCCDGCECCDCCELEGSEDTGGWRLRKVLWDGWASDDDGTCSVG